MTVEEASKLWNGRSCDIAPPAPAFGVDALSGTPQHLPLPCCQGAPMKVDVVASETEASAVRTTQVPPLPVFHPSTTCRRSTCVFVAHSPREGFPIDDAENVIVGCRTAPACNGQAHIVPQFMGWCCFLFCQPRLWRGVRQQMADASSAAGSLAPVSIAHCHAQIRIGRGDGASGINGGSMDGASAGDSTSTCCRRLGGHPPFGIEAVVAAATAEKPSRSVLAKAVMSPLVFPVPAENADEAFSFAFTKTFSPCFATTPAVVASRAVTTEAEKLEPLDVSDVQEASFVSCEEIDSHCPAMIATTNPSLHSISSNLSVTATPVMQPSEIVPTTPPCDTTNRMLESSPSPSTAACEAKANNPVQQAVPKPVPKLAAFAAVQSPQIAATTPLCEAPTCQTSERSACSSTGASTRFWQGAPQPASLLVTSAAVTRSLCDTTTSQTLERMASPSTVACVTKAATPAQQVVPAGVALTLDQQPSPARVTSVAREAMVGAASDFVQRTILSKSPSSSVSSPPLAEAVGFQACRRRVSGELLLVDGEAPTPSQRVCLSEHSRPQFTKASLSKRLARNGAETGDVTLSLQWDGPDNLSLHAGMRLDDGRDHHISEHNRWAANGCMDVVMNAKMAEPEPVDNIFWREPPCGIYVAEVRHTLQRSRVAAPGAFLSDTGVSPVAFSAHLNLFGRSHVFLGEVAPHKSVVCFVFDVAEVRPTPTQRIVSMGLVQALTACNVPTTSKRLVVSEDIAPLYPDADREHGFVPSDLEEVSANSALFVSSTDVATMSLHTLTPRHSPLPAWDISDRLVQLREIPPTTDFFFGLSLSRRNGSSPFWDSSQRFKSMITPESQLLSPTPQPSATAANAAQHFPPTCFIEHEAGLDVSILESPLGDTSLMKPMPTSLEMTTSLRTSKAIALVGMLPSGATGISLNSTFLPGHGFRSITDSKTACRMTGMVPAVHTSFSDEAPTMPMSKFPRDLPSCSATGRLLAFEKISSDWNEMTGDMDAESSGWYEVDSEVTLSGRTVSESQSGFAYGNDTESYEAVENSLGLGSSRHVFSEGTSADVARLQIECGSTPAVSLSPVPVVAASLEPLSLHSLKSSPLIGGGDDDVENAEAVVPTHSGTTSGSDCDGGADFTEESGCEADGLGDVAAVGVAGLVATTGAATPSAMVVLEELAFVEEPMFSNQPAFLHGDPFCVPAVFVKRALLTAMAAEGAAEQQNIANSTLYSATIGPLSGRGLIRI
eukprot:TRINITY_DN44640_c0_g1_i1.p1 TRINITY_DN44640_c0_g1~~TRINITY_DN44640_c0_g1_i1.p1  ORF type:complete len:1236 (+),score=209.51 TRINITY_DN44640_c0_g1_i1:55-3762(+)